MGASATRAPLDPAVDVWARAAAAGDRAAAQRLALQLLPRIRKLVRCLVYRGQDLDDLTQEGLIAVLRGLRSWREDAPFVRWAERVAAHAVISVLRQWKRRPAHDPLDEGSVPGVSLVADPMSQRTVIAALDRLPDEQRHALVLHHLLGMSVPEVAAETGARPETVRSRLRVGRTRLRAFGLPLAEGDEP